MRRPIRSILLTVCAASVMVGCSTGPKDPSTAEVAAAAAKSKQVMQENVQAVRNNPHLSPDQKARILAHLNNPRAVMKP